MNPCGYHRRLFAALGGPHLGRTRAERKDAALDIAAACPHCVTPPFTLTRRREDIALFG